MKFFYTASFLLITLVSTAQSANPAHLLRLVAGRSIHGTGDMRGFSFSTEYAQALNRRLSWTVAVGGSVHDGAYPIHYSNPLSGNPVDGSVRNTTGGAQLAALVGWSPVHSGRHELQFGIGPLFRYQSTSYADVTGIRSPLSTGLPIPVVDFMHTSPQRTYTFGGALRMLYQFSVSRQVVLGVSAGLQTDTRGDLISHTSQVVGRSF